MDNSMLEEIPALEDEDLEQMIETLRQEAERRRTRQREQAAREVEAEAHERGFTNLHEVLRGLRGPIYRRPSTIRYIHPENPSLSWNGRGRRPNWLKALEADGYDPEDLKRSV